jgi:hypothetical protein
VDRVVGERPGPGGIDVQRAEDLVMSLAAHAALGLAATRKELNLQ